jgi:hypothetical protein
LECGGAFTLSVFREGPPLFAAVTFHKLSNLAARLWVRFLKRAAPPSHFPGKII